MPPEDKLGRVGPKVKSEIEDRGRIKSLRGVINFLHSTNFDPQAQGFEFHVDINRHPIIAADLKDLLGFSFEFALTENKDNVIVNTGSEKNIGGDDNFIERRHYSRLSLHTHPNRKQDDIVIDTPSLTDIYISEFASKRTPLVLVSASGLMIYRAPQYDPIEKRPFNGIEVRDLLISYGEANGVYTYFIVPPSPNNKLKDVRDMSREELRNFERRFVEETGMIKQEASWENTNGIQEIMKVINLDANSV